MTTIPLNEAYAKMDARTTPITRTEKVPLFDLCDRVLAEDIVCTKALPAFDNSGMDGYVIKASDSGKKLPIRLTIFAGDNVTETLNDGESFKIMTGGMMPSGADAVVPFENAVDSGDEWVLIPENIKPGENVKDKGEEHDLGSVLVKKGTRLTPAQVSLIASQGITSATCFHKLRIGVFSTGNEIREPWDSAEAHQIYNSNSTGIYVTLKQLGFNPHYIGILPDTLETMTGAIQNLQGYDALFTTGGVSMGEADLVQQAFESCGMETLFHGVEIKPGKPTLMGLLGNTSVYCLPGNPLSAIMNLMMLIMPNLFKMQGADKYHLDFVEASLSETLNFKPKRTKMILGVLQNGKFKTHKKGKYGSGMLTPVAESNAVLFVRSGCTELKENSIVKVVPLYCTLNDASCDLMNG